MPHSVLEILICGARIVRADSLHQIRLINENRSIFCVDLSSVHLSAFVNTVVETYIRGLHFFHVVFCDKHALDDGTSCIE
jgi:hypothetical protein